MNCVICGARVVVKYPSKRACELLEKLTDGLIIAKDLFASLPPGPMLTDPGHGGEHKCPEDHDLHQRREDNGRFYCISGCTQCKKNRRLRSEQRQNEEKS